MTHTMRLAAVLKSCPGWPMAGMSGDLCSGTESQPAEGSIHLLSLRRGIGNSTNGLGNSTNGLFAISLAGG